MKKGEGTGKVVFMGRNALDVQSELEVANTSVSL